MQKSTGKELAVRKNEWAGLLKETLEHHRECEAARGAVTKSQDLSMFHAWQAGIRLNKIKAIVGRGNWQTWIEENFSASIDTAQIYMRIDNQNPEQREIKNPKTEHVRFLEFDTIRKYAIGFAPEKDQPVHKGNAKFGRSVSFLNITNEFDRLEYRHTSGLQMVDFEEAREETKRLYLWLRWSHGDSEENPWLV